MNRVATTDRERRLMSGSTVHWSDATRPAVLSARDRSDVRGRLAHSGLRAVRRLLIAMAASLLIAGSLMAQAYEHRLATSIAPPTRHATPSHVAGGWPNPYMPALVILASLGCAVAAIWLGHLTGIHGCACEDVDNLM